MRRKRSLAAAAAVALVSSVRSLSLNGWHACAVDGKTVSAECATVSMPLCHGDVCDNSENRTVEVFVKRIPAQSSTSTRNFWFFPDHPFAMSVKDVEQQMVLLHEQLLGDVSVYLMDQRGTGRSTLFDCETSQATALTSAQGILLAPSEVGSCADALRTTFGEHFAAAFSLTNAARDVVTFISTFQAKTKVFLYGVGFGTLLVERTMHFPSEEIIGFVLDSTATTSGGKKKDFPYRSRADKDFGVVAKDFLGLCDDNKACSARFEGKKLNQVLEKVLVSIDSSDGACATLAKLLRGNTSEPASYSLRRLLATMLQEMALRPFIPAVVFRLNRCSSTDVDVLSQFITNIQTLLSLQQSQFVEASGAGASVLVFDLIQFSEMWESPPPNENELISRFAKTLVSQGVGYGDLERYCAFTRDRTSACSRFSVNSSISLSYNRDVNWNKGSKIKEQSSVLFLASRFDGEAPVTYAQTLSDALEGESKALLVFESAAHNVLVSTPLVASEDRLLDATPSCTRSILASFVDNDGDLTSFDTSCMTQLPSTVSLNISEALSSQVLGVMDPFDGVLPQPNTSWSASRANDSSTISTPSQQTSVGSLSGDTASIARSRDRYRTAFLVFLVLTVVLIVVVGVLLYRARKKKQLEDEEVQLRKMRGDMEDDNVDFLRDLYNPSPSEWFNYRSNRMHL